MVGWQSLSEFIINALPGTIWRGHKRCVLVITVLTASRKDLYIYIPNCQLLQGSWNARKGQIHLEERLWTFVQISHLSGSAYFLWRAVGLEPVKHWQFSKTWPQLIKIDPSKFEKAQRRCACYHRRITSWERAHCWTRQLGVERILQQ